MDWGEEVIVINKLNRIIMKKLLVIMGLLVSIGGYAQGPEFQAPYLIPKAPMEDFRRTPGPEVLPNQRNFDEIHRNSNLIILMVNENQIRNFNRWRIWHKLKERKRLRIVRRWQKRHERNNIEPESLRRRHR